MHRELHDSTEESTAINQINYSIGFRWHCRELDPNAIERSGHATSIQVDESFMSFESPMLVVEKKLCMGCIG